MLRWDHGDETRGSLRGLRRQAVQPFKLELIGGTQVEVAHPENIRVLPTRRQVHHIEVFRDAPYRMSLIWPEGIVALRFLAPEVY